MTNEEKSLEAARVIKEEIGMSEHSIPRVAEIIDWCLTWKDRQFKEIIEEECAISYDTGYVDGEMLAEQRVKEYLGEILNKLDGNSANVPLKACLFDEIINELYGEK